MECIEGRTRVRGNTIVIAVVIAVGECLGGGPARCSPPVQKPLAVADPFETGAAPALRAIPLSKQPPPPEKRFRRFVPGTKIILTARRKEYFLGENILLDYRISYEGEGALAIDTIEGLRQPDCHVVATDEAGNRAPECTMGYETWGQSGGSVRRGHCATLTIPLMRYCRLEKPGGYRVRAAYDLYWSERDRPGWSLPSISSNDPRWAETTILVRMPDAQQARQIFEEMRRSRFCVHHGHEDPSLRAWWVLPDYADFSCLRYAVYLPILEESVAGKGGDGKALAGIAHIPTAEATAALVRLLKHPNSDLALTAAGAVNDRLPQPQGFRRAGRRNPVELEDADPELVKHSWRGDLANPVRQFARKMVGGTAPAGVQCGAFMLESVGTAEDMPALVAALDRQIPIAEGRKVEAPESLESEPISPARKACMDLFYAVEALAGRRTEPKADPRTPGEIIHFILAVEQRSDFRPAGWEGRWANWARSDTPFVREVALFNAPHPLPEPLRKKLEEGIRHVIATTTEPSVIHRAAEVALNRKIPVDEVLGMLADRLDSRMLYTYIYAFMSDILEYGKPEPLHWACVPVPRPEKVASAKVAWRRFLKEHGEVIREGKRFEMDASTGAPDESALTPP